MRVGAEAKDIGIPPRKVKLVADMVRGKKVGDAMNLLKFTPTPAAKAVAKAKAICKIFEDRSKHKKLAPYGHAKDGRKAICGKRGRVHKPEPPKPPTPPT